MNAQNPLIVQSNNTLLLEVNNPLFAETRDAITVFAHLEKSPEHMHTYSITPLSLWNAAALGLTAAQVIERLEKFTRYPLPHNVIDTITEHMGRFGKLILETDNGVLTLRGTDPAMLEGLLRQSKIGQLTAGPIDRFRVAVPPENRGLIKQALIAAGFPVHDIAGYVDGEPMHVGLKSHCPDGSAFTIRLYQKQASESYVGNAANAGRQRSRCVALRRGKTIVGIYVMNLLLSAARSF